MPLLDTGGVGVAISDYAWQAGIAHVSITATGGDAVHVSEGGRVISCPKRELVAAGQLMLAEGRLRIASGLPLAATLVEELEGYRVKISVAGHDSYSAREGAHDDLVYAVCQLAWYRDWFSQHHDDHIEEMRRHGAREALSRRPYRSTTARGARNFRPPSRWPSSRPAGRPWPRGSRPRLTPA